MFCTFIVLQITMTQRSFSKSSRSRFLLPPLVKCEDVIDTLLYFSFKNRLTRRQRHEAYKNIHKTCTALVLSEPMSGLCEFVSMAQEMATGDCKVRCLPHEFSCNAVNCLYKHNKELVRAGAVQCPAFLCLLCVGWVREH